MSKASTSRTGASRKKPRSTKSSQSLHNTQRWEMPRALLAIIDEHKYVSRLLPLLESEADKIRKNKKADYISMQDVMHYMVNFPDLYHHPKEDLIFDRMSGMKPATAKAVARLRKDHQIMAEQAKSLLQRISTQKNSRSKAKALALADEIILYTNSLRGHMQLEESQVFQPARHLLTETDWEEIDEAIEPAIDPLFGDKIAERYVELMQRYLDDFVSVSSSGSIPVRALESLASSLERAIYATTAVAGLPKRLAATGGEICKSRLRRLVELGEVRDWPAMQSWCRSRQAGDREDWEKFRDQLTEGLDAIHQAIDPEKTQGAATAITLHTEKEIRSYQGSPHQPDSNPRISWQAALTNLLMRFTLKPVLQNARPRDGEKPWLLRKPSDLVPEGTRVETVDQADFHGDWIIPEAGPATRRTILYLPGGAFIAPASPGHRRLAAKLASQTGSRALMVNYRLLPEHPFPAGLEDALAAYRLLLDEGVHPEEIVLAGDSAGGNLVLAMMLAARDEGLPLPLASALISPLTDLTYSGPSRQSNRWKDPLLPKVRNMRAYEKYADTTPTDDPLVSPMYGSFEGFPPMLALVSSTETLLDDTLVVARKARAQGVDVDVEIWASLPHAWPVLPFMPEADAAVERLVTFFRGNFGESS